MKLNPGLLKLDLFCRGIKIDASCDLSKDARPVLRTRGGLGSGLELILPKGLYVNAPIEEHFVKKTPYTLIKKYRDYFIKKNGHIICRIKLPARPKFYERMTTSGKLMSRIGVMQGTYLGIYPAKVCEFWQMGKKMNCQFCSVGLNVGNTEEYEKSVEEVLETVKAAQKEEGITFVHFNTGYLFGEELSILEPYIRAVKKETGLLVGVQCPPSPNLSKYDYLKKMGVDHASFCLEVYDRERFKEICPGKDKYIGQEKYWDAIEYCVKIFGKGKVAGEIIAGLENPLDTIKAIENFAKIGAISTVCIFRPCLGTALEALVPPFPEDMTPVFKKMYEVCLENRIPIGIAPNVKVSLVILPEEGKYFFQNFNINFFIMECKLSILKLLFRIYFRTRIFLKCK
ncbi:MAG: radical SAM protein [Candidatus Omnitrophica bacterium]|nr:radical SAM protein [Candidatus Omnitrophota bacterium]